MKRYFIGMFPAVAMFAVLLLSGCENENNVTGGGGKANISLPSPVSLDNIAGDGDIRTIDVESDGYWSVIATAADGDAAPWISVEPAQGIGNGRVTLSFAKNPSSGASRSGQVCVQLRDESKNVLLPVVQGAASYTTGFQPFVHLIEFAKGDIVNCVSGRVNEAKNAFLFNDGASIALTGAGDMTVAGLTADRYYIGVLRASGWDAENAAWTVAVPVTSELSGTLSFGFGMLTNSSSVCSVPRDWKVEWSGDNATWHDIDAFYAWNGKSACPTESSVSADKSVSFSLLPNINADAYNHRQAVFTVPISAPLAKGSTLYVRVAKAGDTPVKGTAIDPSHIVRFTFGCCVSQFEKKAYHTTTMPEGGQVVLAQGFDDCLSGLDYMSDIGHLAYVTGSAYDVPEGWSASGVTNAIGYIRLAADGTLTTPALASLGATPTDLAVSFKAVVRCSSTDAIDKKAITVQVAEGDGTVEAQPDMTNEFTKRDDCFVWRTFTVRVTGATASTKLTFSNTGQWFLDDIIVTK